MRVDAIPKPRDESVKTSASAATMDTPSEITCGQTLPIARVRTLAVIDPNSPTISEVPISNPISWGARPACTPMRSWYDHIAAWPV